MPVKAASKIMPGTRRRPADERIKVQFLLRNVDNIPPQNPFVKYYKSIEFCCLKSFAVVVHRSLCDALQEKKSIPKPESIPFCTGLRKVPVAGICIHITGTAYQEIFS